MCSSPRPCHPRGLVASSVVARVYAASACSGQTHPSIMTRMHAVPVWRGTYTVQTPRFAPRRCPCLLHALRLVSVQRRPCAMLRGRAAVAATCAPGRTPSGDTRPCQQTCGSQRSVQPCQARDASLRGQLHHSARACRKWWASASTADLRAALSLVSAHRGLCWQRAEHGRLVSTYT